MKSFVQPHCLLIWMDCNFIKYHWSVSDEMNQETICPSTVIIIQMFTRQNIDIPQHGPFFHVFISTFLRTSVCRKGSCAI